MSARVSDADFAALARFLSAEAGLVFDAGRRPGLVSVVAERLDATGAGSVAAYLALVSRPEGADERQRLLDGVTIQETHFFRNAAQVEALRMHLLPALLRRAAAERRPLRVWSAGCSTGEEPYTLAMLALEVRADLGLAGQVEVEVLGTDVSAAAVAVAERAEYAGRTVALAEPGALERWFEPAPGARQRVVAEARGPVAFRVHNLVHDPPPFPPGSVDLVVCRNVTIYFARDTTRALIGRFYATLRPGGYLVLGHAETLWQVSDAFALVPVAEAFAYRKETSGPPARASAGGVVPAPRRARRAVVRAARGTARAADPLLSAATAAVGRATAHARVRGPAADALASARVAWTEGRYAQAAECSDLAVRHDPLLVDAYVLGGQARCTLGDDAGGLDPLRKAVFLDPAAGHAHFLLGGALSRLGQPGPAARSFRAAAATLPLVAADQVRFLLDGRDVDDLVVLCDRLADAAERAAEAAGRRG